MAEISRTLVPGIFGHEIAAFEHGVLVASVGAIEANSKRDARVFDMMKQRRQWQKRIPKKRPMQTLSEGEIELIMYANN